MPVLAPRSAIVDDLATRRDPVVPVEEDLLGHEHVDVVPQAQRGGRTVRRGDPRDERPAAEGQPAATGPQRQRDEREAQAGAPPRLMPDPAARDRHEQRQSHAQPSRREVRLGRRSLPRRRVRAAIRTASPRVSSRSRRNRASAGSALSAGRGGGGTRTRLASTRYPGSSASSLPVHARTANAPKRSGSGAATARAAAASTSSDVSGACRIGTSPWRTDASSRSVPASSPARQGGLDEASAPVDRPAREQRRARQFARALGDGEQVLERVRVRLDAPARAATTSRRRRRVRAQRRGRRRSRARPDASGRPAPAASPPKGRPRRSWSPRSPDGAAQPVQHARGRRAAAPQGSTGCAPGSA